MTNPKPLRVLVVEDEWLIAEYLADLLTDLGYQVVGPVPTVKLGIEVLAENAIDCAVLDVTLGQHKSFPLADILIDLGLPFVFLTGYVNRDLPKPYNGYEILNKPVARDRLQFAMAQLGASPVTDH